MKKVFVIIFFLTTFYSTSVRAGWEWQNPLPDGNTLNNVYFVNANTGWAVGNSGKILRTINSGSNWTSQTSGTTYHLKSVHFVDANTGWAVGEDGIILKTTNAGINWTTQASGTTEILNSVFFVDVNTGWIVGGPQYSGLILKTTNAGTNWTVQLSGLFDHLNSVFFIDANTGWTVGNSGTILKTTNAGTNWTAQSSGTTGQLLSVYFVDANIGWIVGQYSPILKTTNSGTNWTAQYTASCHLYSVNFVDPNTGFAVGCYGILLKTTNSGTNWTTQSLETDHNCVYFIDANIGWIVGYGGVIRKTTNAGSTWTQQTSSVTYNPLYSVCFVNANTGYISGNGSTLLKTTNAGANWVPIGGGSLNVAKVFFVNTTTGWNSNINNPGSFIFRKTTDGGLNWFSQNTTSNAIISIYFINDQIGWIAGFFANIRKTTNGGQNWTTQTAPGASSETFFDIKFINENHGWVCGEGGKIYHTTDGGDNWIQQQSPSGNNWFEISVIDTSIVYIVGNGKIIKTIDGGSNWLIVYSSSDNFKSVWFANQNRGWVSTAGGKILVTEDGGATWDLQTTWTTNELSSLFFIDAFTGWAVGAGGTILKTTTAGYPNGINIQSINPTSFCRNANVSVNYSVVGTFNAGNVFTAQLSDSSGDFSSPISIGTVFSITSGTINCTIPQNITPGSNYRIRVVATNPTIIGDDNVVIINPPPTPSINGNNYVCSENSYTYNSSPPPTTNCLWDVINGTINGSPTGNSVDIIWGTENSGTITLKQTTLAGCIDSTYQLITINPQPIPQITGLDSVCGKEKYLYDGGTGVGNSFLWTVTGGTIEGRTDTSAVYITWDSSGTGQIKLVQAVNATGCMDSITMDVTINPHPVPLVSGPNSVCDKSQHNYTAEIVTGDSYKWYITNGSLDSPDDGTDVWVTWTSPGAGQLKLIETNPTGCVDSIVYSVTVNALPVPQIIGVSDVFSTFIEIYSAQDSTDKTCVWSAVGGTITSSNNSSTVSIEWGSQGGGNVKLVQTDTLTTCTDSTTMNVNITSIPGLTARAGADKSYCEGGSVQIGTQQGAIGGVEPYTYKWTPAEGLSADDISNPIANPLQTTVYTLTVTDAIDSVASDSVTVTVNPYPTPQIQGSTTLIVNTHTLYTSNTPLGTTNKWTVENGNIDSTDNNSVYVEWDSIGQGKVMLEQTITATGCRASDTLDVNIWATIPNLTADAGPDKQLCNGDTIQIGSLNPAIGGTQPYRYKWSPSIGLSNDTLPNPLASPLQTTVYSLTVYDARDSVATDSMIVTVNQKPAPQISGNTSVMVGTEVPYSSGNNTGIQNQWSCSKGKQVGLATEITYDVRWDSIGTGQVYLTQTVIANGCRSSDTLDVNISSTIPPVVANAGDDKTICRSDSIEIGDINAASGGVPPYRYNWIPAEELSSDTIPNPIARPRNTAVYYFTVYDSRNDSATDVVLVRVNPIPDVIITGNTQTVLYAYETYSTTQIPGLTYLWSVINGSPQGAADGSTYQVLWDKEGTGKVILEQTITATNCKSSDTLNVTIGVPFELPALTLGNAEGSPGDVVQIPIYIRNSKYLSDSGATGINANLRFNASLLEPTNPTPPGSLTPDSKERIIQLSLGIAPQSDSTLERLYFKVMLGNDSVATLRLEDVKTNGVNINVLTTSGTFTLTGICREGGTRLIGSNGKVTLMLVRPNPAQEYAEIEYETTESGITQLYLINTLGETALTLVNGEVAKGRKIIKMNIDDIKSGTYFLILKTTTQVRSVRVDVVK